MQKLLEEIMKRVLARLFLVALLAGCGAGGGSLGSSSGTSTGGSAQATVPAANSAAGGQTAVAPTSTATTDTSNLPAAFARFPSSVVVYREGNFAVLETTDVPNHNSPYFPTSSPLYAPYDGSNPNFVKNPNQILSQHIVLRIPIAPQEAAQKQLTPLGPMGISLNGVVFYNQYAAGRSPLTGEINSFDQHGGHPSPGNQYHYHVEPTYL
ncbi:MAG: YHYH protein, partial [Actinobacteria bacterium]|nr:YHYH protein [Actinomycetota bacterium]